MNVFDGLLRITRSGLNGVTRIVDGIVVGEEFSYQ